MNLENLENLEKEEFIENEINNRLERIKKLEEEFLGHKALIETDIAILKKGAGKGFCKALRCIKQNEFEKELTESSSLPSFLYPPKIKIYPNKQNKQRINNFLKKFDEWFGLENQFYYI